jgi:hypothetical protein
MFTQFVTGAVGPPDGLTTLVDRTVVRPLTLESEIKKLFAETWSPGCLLLDNLLASGGYEMQVGPWLPSDEEGRPADESNAGRGQEAKTGVREVKLRVPVSNVPLVRSTNYHVRYKISTRWEDDAEKLCIEAVSATPDVPYGDAFYNCVRIFMEDVEGGVAVTFTCWVVYRKSTRIQRAITLGATVEQRKAADVLLGVLQRHAESSSNPNAVALSSTTKGTASAGDSAIAVPSSRYRRYVEPSCQPCQLVQQVAKVWRQRSPSNKWRSRSSPTSELSLQQPEASSRVLEPDDISSPAATATPALRVVPGGTVGCSKMPSAAMLLLLLVVALAFMLHVWQHDSSVFSLWQPLIMLAALGSLVAHVTPMMGLKLGPKLMFEGSFRD